MASQNGSLSEKNKLMWNEQYNSSRVGKQQSSGMCAASASIVRRHSAICLCAPLRAT